MFVGFIYSSSRAPRFGVGSVTQRRLGPSPRAVLTMNFAPNPRRDFSLDRPDKYHLSPVHNRCSPTRLLATDYARSQSAVNVAAKHHSWCHKSLNSAIFKTARALTFGEFAAPHKIGIMRDIFEEIFENQPLDPTESARRNMRPKLRARFYQEATVGEGAGGFQVLLDGRPVRTPARPASRRPVRELARGAGRRMGRATGQGRSGGDAADPARQLDHRRRGAGA